MKIIRSIQSIIIPFAVVMLSGVSIANAKANTGIQYIAYWTSWSQGNSAYQYPNLSDVPDGVNQAFVAFALESDDNTGLTLQLPEGGAVDRNCLVESFAYFI